MESEAHTADGLDPMGMSELFAERGDVDVEGSRVAEEILPPNKVKQPIARHRYSLILRQGDQQLEARLQSFELAYRMQGEATDAFDINREPLYLRERYGTHVHGRQQRLVEWEIRTEDGHAPPLDGPRRVNGSHAGGAGHAVDYVSSSSAFQYR